MPDEIIRMAREAGFFAQELHCSPPIIRWSGDEKQLERFAALVAAHAKSEQINLAYQQGYEEGSAHEREACAKVCLETDVHPDHGEVAGDFLAGHIWGCEDCAAAIRARCDNAG